MSIFHFTRRSFFGNVSGIPEIHQRCHYCRSTTKVKQVPKGFYKSSYTERPYLCKKCRKTFHI